MTRTLSKAAHFEVEVKKSRFIAQAQRCSDEREARAFLAQIGDPTATHNCWAWKSGQRYRFDDDGEPGGTAGRPILAAIENQGMDEVAVVVTRYYGGVKLGTGGLARAYGGSAAECLRTADSQPLVRTVSLTAELPFDLVSLAHQILSQHGASKRSESYNERGLSLTIECPESVVVALCQALKDASAGQASIRSDQSGAGAPSDNRVK
ncbi:MAG: YigZ family protein [Pseudomonadota bacterium]